jgi:hypothetical protein
MRWARRSGRVVEGKWRWHLEWTRDTFALCLWVPWRAPGRPLIYWWVRKRKPRTAEARAKFNKHED